jgi:hypothetical protein
MLPIAAAAVVRGDDRVTVLVAERVTARRTGRRHLHGLGRRRAAAPTRGNSWREPGTVITALAVADDGDVPGPEERCDAGPLVRDHGRFPRSLVANLPTHAVQPTATLDITRTRDRFLLSYPRSRPGSL